MSRKERRARARRSKIENLYRPVKADKRILIAIAVVTAIIVLGTYFIKYS